MTLTKENTIKKGSRTFLTPEALAELNKTANTGYSVKSWFITKNFSQNEKYIMQIADSADFQKETEKAVLLKWNSKHGSFTKWIPKSCLN